MGRYGLFVVLCIVGGWLLVTGCGGAEGPAEEAATSAEAAAPVVDQATAATITGSILFEGTQPTNPTVIMDTEEICHEQHGSAPVASETVLVNDNGTLRNVFVYVKDGLGDRQFPTPREPVVFDQKGCWYSPHVVGIQVRQPLEILNSDPGVLHNIHALSEKGNGFNMGMPGKEGMKITKQFRKSELMVRVKCDIHSWMSAYIGVLDHPYYDVTGEDGVFTIESLPPGDYVVEAWHEKYGTQTRRVQVGEREVKETTLTFRGS